jgi:predicted HicB family RNase H-like nuclease
MAAEMRKTESMSLRVSSDFKRRLVEEAKKDKRSLANYIEATLTRLWQEKDFDATRRSRKIT